MTDETTDRAGGAAAHPSPESRETAALHALGALSPAEARAFEEHLRQGCPACKRDAASFREVVGELGSLPAPVPPPSALRERLLARVSTGGGAQVWKEWRRASGEAAGDLFIVRAGSESWQSTSVSGVRVKPLAVDSERRSVTMLVRMDPGASYPRHRHGGPEECYVLQGDLRVGGDVLHAGDFQRAEGGSEHALQSTEGGCLLLIMSSQDDELLEGSAPAREPS